MHEQAHAPSLDRILQAYERVWIHGVAARRDALAAPAELDVREEAQIAARFSALASAGGVIFARDFFADGHVTGSAMVVSSDLTQVLLTLHGKLGKWLQLGGHADGHPVPHDAAMREALEESGLEGLTFLPYERSLCPRVGEPQPRFPLPFDFDVHEIPARGEEPTHFHYDVRYVIVADPARAPVRSAESKDLRWFTVAEAERLTSERSMHRQFQKLSFLKDLLRN